MNETIREAAVSIHFFGDVPMIDAEAILKGTGIAPLVYEEWE